MYLYDMWIWIGIYEIGIHNNTRDYYERFFKEIIPASPFLVYILVNYYFIFN